MDCLEQRFPKRAALWESMGRVLAVGARTYSASLYSARVRSLGAGFGVGCGLLDWALRESCTRAEADDPELRPRPTHRRRTLQEEANQSHDDNDAHGAAQRKNSPCTKLGREQEAADQASASR